MADNSNVEERIVAAKFDASNFEKGVNKTVKKLDELEKKLSFKKTGESITDFSKKTAEAQEKATSSIEKLTERYTSFVGMIKQKLLGGIADQVVNVFFRMEKAALSFAKSMTFDQISAGMQKYEDALTSVRMIVNSYKTVTSEITGLTEKIHYTQDEAYSAIKNLQAYADETSYSMSQMTDAMSKMVSAGVGLDQAEKNVQGIANACAAAGVNATDAARAFYNLSQAYSSGSLKYTDYRSLQLLNMTNENFEEQLVAAGVKAGTLKETTDKKGNKIYVTKKSDTNKKVTAGKKFTRSQVSDALKYGWAGTDVMDYLFGEKFYVDVEDFAFIAEASKGEGEEGTASKYFRTSSKERTKVREEYLLALKDYEAIGSWVEKLDDKSSVWKEKYEKVKDDADKRKALLDELIEEADWVREVATKHAAVKDEDILKWIDSLADTDQRKIDYLKLKDDQKKRKEFLEEIKKDESAMSQIQGKSLGLNAEQLDKAIMALDEKNEMRTKYMEMTNAEKKVYLKQLIDEAESLGKIKNKYDEIAVKAFLAAREARNLQDVIKAVGDYVSSKWTKVFENLIGTLEDAKDFFTDLAEIGVAGFFINLADWVEEVSDAFNLGGSGSDLFRQTVLALNEALGKLLDIFFVLLPESEEFGQTLFVMAGDINIAMVKFRDWTIRINNWFRDEDRLSKIQGFFANLSGIFSIIGKLATIAFETIGLSLTAISPILDAVIIALEKITEPIGELGDKENTEAFDKIREAIENLFKVINPISEALAPIIVSIANIIGEIAKFFITGAIDTAIANITFFSDAFGLLLELLGIGSAQQDNGHGVMKGIADGVNDLAAACHDAMTVVTDFFGKLFDDIRLIFGLKPKDENASTKGGLFANVKNFLETNEFIKRAQEWLAQARVDIQNWFDQAVKDVQTWFANLPQTISNAINGIFFKKVKENKEDSSDVEASSESATSTLYTWLSSIKDKLGEWFEKAKTDITTWFSELPGKIASFFAGFLYTTEVPEKYAELAKKHNLDFEGAVFETPLKIWLDGVIESVSNFIANIPEYLLKGIGKIVDLFGLIVNCIFGDNSSGDTKNKTEVEKKSEQTTQQWMATFIAKIKEAIKAIPDKIKKFIEESKAKFKEAWGTIKKWFNETETGKQIQALGENILNGIKDFIVKLPEHIKNIIRGIGAVGRDIISIVKDVLGIGKIGEEVQDGMEQDVKKITLKGVLDAIADIGETIANEFLSWFTGTNDIEYNVNWFIDKVIKFITYIPNKLWDEAIKLGNTLTGLWTYIVARLRSDTHEGATGNPTADQFAKDHPEIANTVDGLVAWIKSIPTQIEDAWTETLNKINNFWNSLSSYWSRLENIRQIEKALDDPNLSPKKRSVLLDNLEEFKRNNTSFGKDYPMLAGVVSTIHGWSTGIIDGIESGIKDVADYIQNIPKTLRAKWDEIKDAVIQFFDEFIVFWNDPSAFTQNNAEADANRTPTEFEQHYPGIAGFIIGLRTWLNDVPSSLEAAFNNATNGIHTFFNEFSTYQKQFNRISEIKSKLNDPKSKLTANQRIDLEKDLADLESNPTNFETKYPFISGIVGSFRDWINGFPSLLAGAWDDVKEKISSFWTDFIKFITDPETWADFKNGEIHIPEDFEDKYPTLSNWIKIVGGWVGSTYVTISKGWENAKERISSFWTDLTTFLVNPETWADFKNGEIHIPEDFEDKYPTLSNWIKIVGGWVGSTYVTISKGWKNAKERISSFFTDLITFLVNPETWADFKNGEIHIPKSFEDKYSTLSNWIKTVGGWVGSIYGTISEKWEETKTNVMNFWNEFLSFITDPTVWSDKENKTRELTVFENDYPTIANWILSFVTWIEGIPTTLETAFNNATNGVRTFFNEFSTYWRKLDKINEIKKKLNDPNLQLTDDQRRSLKEDLADMEYSPTSFEMKYPLASGLVESFNGWVSDIPSFVVDSVNSATEALNGFWNDIVDAFNGNGVPEDKASDSESLGTRIRNWIINFFANLPTYITDGVQAAADFINNGIISLTDFINNTDMLDADKVTETLQNVADDAYNKIEDTNKNLIENSEKVSEEDSPKKSFIDGIVNIGTTLWKIITETIPNFISSGFEWVKRNWAKEDGIRGKIIGLFDNVSKFINPGDFKLEDLGNLIREAIQNLPETVGNLWNIGEDFIRRLLGIKKPLPEELAKKLGDESSLSSSAKNALRRNLDKLGYDVSSTAQKANIGGELQGIATDWGTSISTILTDVVNNIGPLLLGAWNGVLSTFSKLFGMLGEWFSGGVKDEAGNIDTEGLDESIKHNFGDGLSTEFKTALHDIGQTIFNLITDIIPKFIGSAFGTVIEMIPSICSSFLEGLNGALGNTIEKEGSETTEEVASVAKKVWNIDEAALEEILSWSYSDVLSIKGEELANYNEDMQEIIKLMQKNREYYDYLRNPDDKDLKQTIKGKTLPTFEELFGLVDNLNEDAPTDTAVKSAKNSIIDVGGILNTLVGMMFNINEEGKITGFSWQATVAAGILLLIKIFDIVGMFKDTFHWSRSDVVLARNSFNAVFKVAMEALIVGMLFATVCSQMNETQFNNASLMLDKVISIIEKVVLISAGMKGAEVITDLAGIISGKGISTTLIKGGTGIGVAAVITSISSTIQDITDRLPTMGHSIGDMAEALKNAVTDIPDALDCVESVGTLLGKLKELMDKAKEISAFSDTVNYAKTTVDEMLSPIKVFAEVTKGPEVHAKETIDSVVELIGLTDKMGEFVEFVDEGDTFDRFKYAISSLGSALSFYAVGSSVNVRELTDSGIKNALDFLKAILGDDELPGLAKKLMAPDLFGQKSFDMQTSMEQIVMFAGGLAKLGDAAKNINDDTGTNINTFIREINKIEFSTDLDDPNNVVQEGSKITSFASAMISLGSGISSLVTAAGTITGESFKSIETILDYLVAIAGSIKGFQNSDLAKMIQQKGDISTFGTAIENLGIGLKGFIQYINESALQTLSETDDSKAEILKRNIRFVLEMVQTLAESASVMQYGQLDLIFEVLDTGGEKVVKFVNAVGMMSESFKEANGVELTSDRFDQIRNAVEMFKEMSIGLSNIAKLVEYTPARISSVMDSLYSVHYNYANMYGIGDAPFYEEIPEGLLPRLLGVIKKLSEEITEDEISQAQKLVPILREFFYAFSSCIAACILTENAIFTTDPLDETIQYLIDNFDKLNELINKAESIDIENLGKVKSLFEAIKEMGEAIQSYSMEVFNGLHYENKFTSALTAFKNLDYDNLSEAFSNFIKFYTEIINDPENHERLTTAGFTMAKTIASGIQQALDSDDPEYTLKFHAVIDDSTVREQIDGLNNGGTTINFGANASFTESLKQAFSDATTITTISQNVASIKTKVDDNLENIKLYVGALGTEIIQIKTAMNSMGVYLDKDKLVGELAPAITEEQDRLAEDYMNRVTTGGR